MSLFLSTRGLFAGYRKRSFWCDSYSWINKTCVLLKNLFKNKKLSFKGSSIYVFTSLTYFQITQGAIQKWRHLKNAKF